MKKTVNNVLAPLEFIVSVIGGILVLVVVITVPFVVFGSGSMMGLGERESCLSTSTDTVLWMGGVERVDGLAHGVDAYATGLSVCTQHPSTAQKSLEVSTHAPGFLFALGLVGALWLVVRSARRHGLFDPHVALGVGRLGLYLLLGSLVAAAVQAEASVLLLHTLTTRTQADQFLRFFHVSWASVMAGFGLLTVGRALGQAVGMQREIDATV